MNITNTVRGGWHCSCSCCNFTQVWTPGFYAQVSIWTLFLKPEQKEVSTTRNKSAKCSQNNNTAYMKMKQHFLQLGHPHSESLVLKPPLLMKQQVKDPGHPTKCASGRLQLNTYTLEQTKSETAYAEYSMGPLRKTSSHKTCQGFGTLVHSHLSSRRHCGLIFGLKKWNRREQTISI